MGTCMYCGKAAGFLRSRHTECEDQHLQRESAKNDQKEGIATEVRKAIKGTESFDQLASTISAVDEGLAVTDEELKVILIKEWENAVNDFLEDTILDEIEETRLAEFKGRFGLSQSDLDRNGR